MTNTNPRLPGLSQEELRGLARVASVGLQSAEAAKTAWERAHELSRASYKIAARDEPVVG